MGARPMISRPTRIRVSARRLARANAWRDAARRGSTRARKRLASTRAIARRRLPALLMTVIGLIAVALIIRGIAMIFEPAGWIAAGLALLAILTFNPVTVRKLTWPR